MAKKQKTPREIEKDELMKKREKYEEKCDTLPQCEEGTECANCENFIQMNKIDERIDEIEAEEQAEEDAKAESEADSED